LGSLPDLKAFTLYVPRSLALQAKKAWGRCQENTFIFWKEHSSPQKHLQLSSEFSFMHSVNDFSSTCVGCSDKEAK